MQTKLGFEVLRIVDIPSTYFSREILSELSDRESFVDTDEDLGEQIFSADVFEQIACEQEEKKECNCLIGILSDADLKVIDDLAEDLGEFELVRITRV